jgi:Zn finger protein HypA/HybF involved in hydrogenase expression
VKTGPLKCPKCNQDLYKKEVKYTISDIAHDIGCPNCDEKLGSVRKGRIDYIVTKNNIV